MGVQPLQSLNRCSGPKRTARTKKGSADSEHDRLRTQVAVLLGEAQWRRLLAPGGEEGLREQGATDDMIAFFRSIGEGNGQP
jgi:hypothetical protein